MKNKIIVISSFADFLSKFEQFLFCFGSIKPSLDLQVSDSYYYDFQNGYSKEQLNKDIVNNKDLFVWESTCEFYYPNTNMFSGSNEQRNIQGYFVNKKL